MRLFRRRPAAQTLRMLCLALLILAICVGGRVLAQTLTVTPAVALVDEPVTIRAGGLAPGEAVKITSEVQDAAGHTWHADAQFAADSSGSLDLSQAPALKGSYRGVSAMGLIWSMRPSGEGRIFQLDRALGPQVVHFTLLSKAGQAKAELKQLSLAQGVHMLQVNGLLHGVLFLPPAASSDMAQSNAATGSDPVPSTATSKRPALLVVGGSEGGMPMRRAAWLANHGYVALALAYFRMPGLPDQIRDIKLEYFGNALSWLAQRPEVDPQHIGVVGGSRGGELALQLGSMYPMVHAVVAFVPANVRVQACCDGLPGAAWTFKGEELAYAMGRMGSEMGSNTRAQIPIENTHGPILLISGKEDGVWPSSDMTARAEARLRSAHFQYQVERLDYDHAGHRAGSPDIVPSWSGELRHPVSGREESMGGTPEGNAFSTLDATPRVLSFLSTALAQTAGAAPASKP